MGLSSVQIAGIIVGSLVLLALIVTVALLIVRRLVPQCGHLTGHFAADRQVLVIEGPEDGDSYVDEDEDDEEDEDELHHVETA